MKIHERILELRIERNLSQSDLGRAIGVNPRSVSYWEAGVNEPKASYIYLMSKFFGVTADYLLGLED